MIKFIPALALLLAASTAFAQGGATQSPPAPNASTSMPEPVGSVPAGALTSAPITPQGTTTSTTTGQVLSQPTPGLQTPAAPSGSTGPTGSPSDAMNRTVPQPVK